MMNDSIDGNHGVRIDGFSDDGELQEFLNRHGIDPTAENVTWLEHPDNPRDS